MKKYDAIIIGFGKAGKTLAYTLAVQGKEVALIEKSKDMYGGTCINVGCIPTKSLLNSAGVATPGISTYLDAIEEKNRLTGMLRGKNYQKLAQLEHMTLYDGVGSFVSPTEVLVETDEEQFVITGEKIFINTGSVPVKPVLEKDIEENDHVYTSDTLMEQKELPKHLVLIGAGYIGMEFASIYSRFGSKVTVLQDGDVFLPREDRDIADCIMKNLEKQGVEFKMGVQIQRIFRGDIIYKEQNEKKILQADAILFATGRKPNISQLKLENAGVELTERNAIKVDERLRTTAPNIFAMGDVTGKAQFTYTSLDDYRIVLSQLLSSDEDKHYTLEKRKNVPYAVFMDTPYAKVGLNESEATKLQIPYKVLKLETAAVPKAQVLKKTSGFMKALVHAETNEILGVMLLCPEAYEVINIVKLALDFHMKAEQMKNQIFTHPTMSEALNDLFAMA